MNLTVSPISLSPGVGYASPLARSRRHEESEIPTPESPSTTVVPSVLTDEQMTKLRYLGMAEALRRLVNWDSIGQAPLRVSAIPGGDVEGVQAKSETTGKINARDSVS